MEKVIFEKLNTLDSKLFYYLKLECLQLAERLNWNDGANQIMLQTYSEDADDFTTGIGRIQEAKFTDETAYKYTQPSLKGSYIDKLLSSMDVFRTRIMLVKPKTCYSIHSDPTVRLHLALETNPDCYFVFPEHNQVQKVLPDRTIYFVDTRELHTFMNCGRENRIHIVMCK
jgi:hypothetical protein